MVTVRSDRYSASMAGRYAYRRAVRPELRRAVRRVRGQPSLGLQLAPSPGRGTPPAKAVTESSTPAARVRTRHR